MDVQTKTAPASTAAAVDAGASCPDCERTIHLAPHSKMGQRVICRRCGADLELVSLEPPELDWVTTEFEADWRLFDHHWR
jgi:alpha-aminoadipate carrier protein LysW